MDQLRRLEFHLVGPCVMHNKINLLFRIIYFISMATLGYTVGDVAFNSELDFYFRMTLFTSFLITILMAKKYYS